MKSPGGKSAFLGSAVTHGILVILLWGTLSLAARPAERSAEVFSTVAEAVALDEPVPEPIVEPIREAAEPDLPTLEETAPPEAADPFPTVDRRPLRPSLLALPADPLGRIRRIPRRAVAPAAAAPPPAPVPVAVAAPVGPSRTAKPAPGNPAPLYPKRAIESGREGTVILRVTVDAGGNVLKVEVSESSGSSLLDREAVRTVSKWRFHPALRRGRTVTARIEVPIRFQLG